MVSIVGGGLSDCAIQEVGTNISYPFQVWPGDLSSNPHGMRVWRVPLRKLFIHMQPHIWEKLD